MRILSHIISWVFLPLLMPIYAISIAMFIPSMEMSFFQENTLFWLSPNYKMLILLWFITFSFMAPGILLLILKLSNSISTIEMDDKNERGIPITITAIFCFILGVLFLTKAPDNMLPPSIYAMPWGGFVAIVIAGIINRKDKISLHAIGAGMLMGFIIAYYVNQAEFYFEIIVFGVIVSGLVMSARLYLRKHTLKQVIKGFSLGFFCIFMSIILFTYFKS